MPNQPETPVSLRTAAPCTRRAFAARAGALGAALALLAGAPLVAGCARENTDGSGAAGPLDAATEHAASATFAFYTFCTFSVYGDDAAPALLARECARYDGLFDLYDAESDIARVNAAGGAPTQVDPATAEVVERALTFCAEADGRFDITIGAVSRLWDFEEGVRPTDEEVAAALAHVDWRGVTVDTTDPTAPTITLADPVAALDLGGIAKGFIADKLVETLRAETDATAAIISLGGNIVCWGEKPDGTAWSVGVRDPNDPGGTATVGTARLSVGAGEAVSLVTSGLYERTFELDGVTYWHILDPATGMPVATDTASVTVVSPSSTQADALSTTLFVDGSVRGAEVADAYDDTAAYFILTDGTVRETAHWDALTDFEA